VDTYAASHLSLSSVSAGAAASEAEVKKQNKYRSLSNDFNFVAVGVETSGVLGKQASKFLKELGKKLMILIDIARTILFTFRAMFRVRYLQVKSSGSL